MYKYLNITSYFFVFLEISMFFMTIQLNENDKQFLSSSTFIMISCFNIPLILILQYLKGTLQQITYKTSKDIYNQSNRVYNQEDRTFDYNSYKKATEIQKNKQEIELQNILDFLGIKTEIKDLTEKELKKEYRKLAKMWHPDFGKNEMDIKIRNENMSKINEAFERIFVLMKD